MSDRLIQAYLNKYEREVRERVMNLPWNKEHMAKMHKAGEKYKKCHPGFEEDTCPDICTNCGKSDRIEFVKTTDLIHYGKLVCRRCKSRGAPEGKYVRWIPYPMRGKANEEERNGEKG